MRVTVMAGQPYAGGLNELEQRFTELAPNIGESRREGGAVGPYAAKRVVLVNLDRISTRAGVRARLRSSAS
jgi:hypothetical protein